MMRRLTVSACAALRGLIWACAVALLLQAMAVHAEVAIPPVARVTDLSGTLDAAQRQALIDKLSTLEADKGSQLAVLVLPTTEPETIEQYAIRVAEAWKLGRKGVDDGVLLTVAVRDREVRIEVGYGLEGAIPDAIAKRVIEEFMLPRFREGDLPGGIDAGVDRIIALIDGEPLPDQPSSTGSPGGNDAGESLPVLFLIALSLGQGLRRALGPAPAGLLAGGGSSLLVWAVGGELVFSGFFGLAVFLMTLVGARGGFRVGGGSHSGGSRSGGGFSGGGGGFGGGGASGRW